MMRVHYISPSTLPSRTANSIHVVWQCDGLARAGAQVTLYAKRSVADARLLPAALAASYGIDADGLDIVSYFSRGTLADNARIAALAIGRLRHVSASEPVLSRNLYAAFVLGVLQRRPLIFETHQLELGLRKALQRSVMTRPWVTTVVISHHLEERLARHHGVPPRHPRVLPDAAPEGVAPIPAANRRETLRSLVPAASGNWKAVCGYFGHLYQGRGIEVIEALAAARPDILFLVYGGNDADVQSKRVANAHANLQFMGHVPHPFARRIMSAVDVLLMPYQRHVSIGTSGHDTSGWMSPMKMFEYLATGVPIVASSLPALDEILEDGRNCVMASPDRPQEWSAAIDRIMSSSTLAEALGEHGHAQYKTKHTWTRRAEALLEIARGL